MQDKGSMSYQKYLQGDDQGMVELIRDYKDGLMLYLNSLVCNIQAAEELAMDTFVKLGVNRPKNRGTATFKTWLYTIGRNLAIDQLRKRAKQKEVSLEDCQALRDDEACLERSYIRREDKILLHRTMRRLTPQYRQVLWLIYFEGFSMKETAKVMGKTVHSVEVQASRGRKALRELLEKEGFQYENL